MLTTQELLFVLCFTYALRAQVYAGCSETVWCGLSSPEVTWYRHKPGQSPQAILLYSEKSALPPSYYNGFMDTKFKASSEGGTNILVIVNVTEDDTATYYCSKERGKVEIGNGSLVTLTGNICGRIQDIHTEGQTVDIFLCLSIVFAVIISLTYMGIAVYCFRRRGSRSEQTKQRDKKTNETDYVYETMNGICRT